MHGGERERYHGLDLLRFIAAGLVVFFHFGYLSWGGPYAAEAGFGPMPRFPELAQFASLGWVGVEVFFVISGFVIAYSMRGAGPAQFFRSRALRLLPALWIAASMTAVALWMAGASPGDLAPLLARSLVLFPKGPWVDGVYWTLCLEVMFYGAVFLLILARRAHWLEGFAMVMGLVSTAACLAALAPGAPGEAVRWALEFWPLRLLELRNGVQFALGVMLFLLISDRASLRRWLLVALFATGALAEIRISAGPEGASSAAAMSVWAACMGLFALSILPGASVMIRRLGLEAAFARLGELTYPLYLSHQVIGWAFMSAVYARFGSRWFALAAGVWFALALTATILRLEPYVRRGLDGLLRRSLPGSIPAGVRTGGRAEPARR